jgi:acyl dehydratase
MSDFEAGFEFPALKYQLTRSIVEEYRKAVGAKTMLVDYVPPLAVAAFAMKTMTESAIFIPGSIHASQDFEFLKPVAVNSTLTCKARIAQNIKRKGMNMLVIDINAFDQKDEKVLSGKATIILPPA